MVLVKSAGACGVVKGAKGAKGARRALDVTYRVARRIVVTVVGATVIVIGIAMIVLPGPATLVIPLGLAILGLEFAWARRWLRRVRDKGAEMVGRARGRGRDAPPDDRPADGPGVT
jgi:tellurite resistance protein TerC